jgi:hypothetical protein
VINLNIAAQPVVRSAIITPLSPCSAAHLSDRALVNGSQSCGCGFPALRKTCGSSASSWSPVRIAGGYIGIADSEHVLQPTLDLVHLEVGDGLLVVPFRIAWWDREVLAVYENDGSVSISSG